MCLTPCCSSFSSQATSEVGTMTCLYHSWGNSSETELFASHQTGGHRKHPHTALQVLYCSERRHPWIYCPAPHGGLYPSKGPHFPNRNRGPARAMESPGMRSWSQSQTAAPTQCSCFKGPGKVTKGSLLFSWPGLQVDMGEGESPLKDEEWVYGL